MNPFEMVVLIIAIIMVAKISIERMRLRDARPVEPHDNAEIAALKARIAVLERLATDDNQAKLLDREIDKLR